MAEMAPAPSAEILHAAPDIEALTAEAERLDARIDRLEARKQQDAQWAGLRASGWTDEGVAGIGEHMRRTGCDIATAVAQFEKLNPPAELVATTNGGRFHFLSPQPSGVSMKGLLEDADGWLDGAIAASLRESRGM